MIGNSRDISTVMRHTSKMFAGIASMVGEGAVTALASKEGEQVELNPPVSCNDSIIGWLSKVEKGMKVELISLSNDALGAFPTSLEGDNFDGWAEKFPAQVLLVIMQVKWCESAEANLKALDPVINEVVRFLEYLAERVLTDLPRLLRQKFEQLMTELIHERDHRCLLTQGIGSSLEIPKFWKVSSRLYRCRILQL